VEDELSITEALKTAIAFEGKVCGVYKKALSRVRDGRSTLFLEHMAEEEKEHILFLRAKLEQWERTGLISEKDRVPVPPLTQRDVEDRATVLEALLPGTADATEISLLYQALDLEREALGFYQDMVARLPDLGRVLFKQFVEIEEEHVSLVETKLKYYDRPHDLGG
jgi:rubrerythrin